ncbi:MAG: exonuclease domain-containing protein, partial [Steroidobacteraceae bacterium]
MSAAIDRTLVALLPGRYACVDLETTGADPQFARIIEVGIVLIDDGVITGRWSSLVDPERPISERIQAFTGISNEMVAAAPTFHQVMDEIHGRCSERIFAAHNARFDYGFLRTEFARAGKRFSASLLCTVKLSRRLDTSVRVHNLDAVIERYGLTCERRHRALPDAQAVADFLLAAISAYGAARVQQELDHQTRAIVLPPQLPASLLEELPEAPGVYCCMDAAGNALQVGRANHLRGAVLSLLTAE